jgi:hypothetical protein
MQKFQQQNHLVEDEVESQKHLNIEIVWIKMLVFPTLLIHHTEYLIAKREK